MSNSDAEGIVLSAAFDGHVFGELEMFNLVNILEDSLSFRRGCFPVGNVTRDKSAGWFGICKGDDGSRIEMSVAR